MKNTKKFGIARILIIPQKNKFEAVCLDFDLIEEAQTLREAKKLIEAAVRGYVVNICKNGLDDSLLNRPAAKKYWKMFEQYQKTGLSQFIFKYHHANYVATFDPLPRFLEPNWLIGIVIPTDDFVGQLHRTYLLTAGVGFLILILGIILISGLTSYVVNPLKKITQE